VRWVIEFKLRRELMSVARNFEVSSTSNVSFEDAINKGIQGVSDNVNNIRGAWIKEQKVDISNGKISAYNVMMIVTAAVDDVGNTG
jgi:dodecin